MEITQTRIEITEIGNSKTKTTNSEKDKIIKILWKKSIKMINLYQDWQIQKKEKAQTRDIATDPAAIKGI